MAESQAGNLFQDWYDRYVRKPGLGSPSTYAPPQIEANTPWTPGATPVARPTPMLSTPTTFPVSATPAPSAPVVSPVVDPVDAESATLDAAAGNQDGGWTGPTPGEPPAPGTSWTDKLQSGFKNVGEGLKDPAKMGLLAAGLSMMATPPRQVPYSNMEILGNAGLTGVKYYEQALEAKRKDELMKQTAEEHKLALQERTDWHKADIENKQERTKIETKKEETQRIIRMANAQRAGAQTGRIEDLRKLVPQEYADAIGMPEASGMTWEQFNRSQSATVAATKPEPTAVVIGNTGTATVIPKTPGAVYPGVGKTKSPPAGTRGGRPSVLAERMAIAKKSLRQKNPGVEPTTEQVAQHARELFPPAGVQVAATKKKGSSLRLGGGAPPIPGYIPDPKGRTVGGKKVWVSPDGKSAVVEK